MAGETNTGGMWVNLIGGILQPKTAQPTTIQTPQPVSEQQQRTNQILFVVAMVLVIGMTVGGVYLFTRK